MWSGTVVLVQLWWRGRLLALAAYLYLLILPLVVDIRQHWPFCPLWISPQFPEVKHPWLPHSPYWLSQYLWPAGFSSWASLLALLTLLPHHESSSGTISLTIIPSLQRRPTLSPWVLLVHIPDGLGEWYMLWGSPWNVILQEVFQFHIIYLLQYPTSRSIFIPSSTICMATQVFPWPSTRWHFSPRLPRVTQVESLPHPPGPTPGW